MQGEGLFVSWAFEAIEGFEMNFVFDRLSRDWLDVDWSMKSGYFYACFFCFASFFFCSASTSFLDPLIISKWPIREAISFSVASVNAFVCCLAIFACFTASGFFGAIFFGAAFRGLNFALASNSRHFYPFSGKRLIAPSLFFLKKKQKSVILFRERPRLRA